MKLIPTKIRRSFPKGSLPWLWCWRCGAPQCWLPVVIPPIHYAHGNFRFPESLTHNPWKPKTMRIIETPILDDSKFLTKKIRVFGESLFFSWSLLVLPSSGKSSHRDYQPPRNLGKEDSLQKTMDFLEMIYIYIPWGSKATIFCKVRLGIPSETPLILSWGLATSSKFEVYHF